MDVKIDDEDRAVNLLCTLPESWGQVLSSISLSTTDTLEFEQVSLWNKLEGLYMTKSVTNKICLKRQLYNMRMKEGTKIVDH